MRSPSCNEGVINSRLGLGGQRWLGDVNRGEFHVGNGWPETVTHTSVIICLFFPPDRADIEIIRVFHSHARHVTVMLGPKAAFYKSLF